MLAKRQKRVLLVLIGIGLAWMFNLVGGLLTLSAMATHITHHSHPSELIQVSDSPVTALSSPDAKALPLPETHVPTIAQIHSLIRAWQSELDGTPTPANQLILHQKLGQAYQQLGQLEAALQEFELAIALGKKINPPAQQMPLQAAHAQVLSKLGKHHRTIVQTESILNTLKTYPNPTLELSVQGIQGNANWALGDYDKALTAHRRSLDIAKDLENPVSIATAWGNVANVWVSLAQRHQYQKQVAFTEGDSIEVSRLEELLKQDRQRASTAYENSVAGTGLHPLQEAQLRSNWLRFLKTYPQAQSSESRDRPERQINRVVSLFNAEPTSQAKAVAMINLATVLTQKSDDDQSHLLTLSVNGPLAMKLLQQAIDISESVNSQRTLSFAQGALGHLYEQQGDVKMALSLTRQAQFSAELSHANDSLYRWLWQAGRIQKNQGQFEAAISSYRQAIAMLQSIRSDLLVASKGVQFEFRDSVEPLYRDLISLLVDHPTVGDGEQTRLQEILDNLELLKLSELQNYFGDDCAQVTRSDPNAAITHDSTVLYSVVLPQKLVWILRSPEGHLQSHSISMSAQQLEEDATQLRYALENVALESYVDQSRQVYDRIIRPLAADLTALNPKTLVFINDGVLRKLPMAALHDGEQFLVQKYAIANTLSLTLTHQSAVRTQSSKALIFGLTEARPPFNALPNVDEETNLVKRIVSGDRWLDQAFTLQNLARQMTGDRYSIIHLATHAKFGVDSNQTFLLAYDQRLTLDDIESSLRQGGQNIDLLTLSACQTAAGDDRAALGLAGTAVRAGVKSTLASLWSINDADTVPLIESFYDHLEQPGVSKAEALRMAQLKMIESPFTRHPALWSSLILIGNWG